MKSFCCPGLQQQALPGSGQTRPYHSTVSNDWGRIALLIATAKINGAEPFACLQATLEAIAAGHPANQLDELLPWNFSPSS
uniref:transposase domain-containing protein n=1 Tax=Phaeobacter inhibens TaxID=221822 RepID=UPI00295E9A9A|nr:transposase domain-containing protein [Phaeobacter inhibens]